MEIMHRSLHEVYKLVYDKLKLRIPELVVGRMAESVSGLVDNDSGLKLPLHLLIDTQGTSLSQGRVKSAPQRCAMTP